MQDRPPDSLKTNLDPQTSPLSDLTPAQLVAQWRPAAGLEDVALLEGLLDEAVMHLGNLLKLLPDHHKQAEWARDFLAQFESLVSPSAGLDSPHTLKLER